MLDQSAGPKEPTKSPTESGKDEILRVGGGTDAKKLAASIVISINKGARPLVEYIGAGAGQQAIKAIALASTTLSRAGQYLSVVPVFISRQLPDAVVTGIQLRVIIHNL